MEKTSELLEPTFVRGFAVSPASALLGWLDREARGENRLLRLPLVLRRGDSGFSLRGARIGGGSDAIEVYANDSALGIGLADRAAKRCKDQPTCAFSVAAYWQGKRDGAFQIDVVRVFGTIGADALSRADHVEIEEKPRRAIDRPAAFEHGFPLPAGARKNESLGGATSVAPGKNYTLSVYDIDSPVEVVSAFYDAHLPDAVRAAEGQGVRWSNRAGTVRLARLDKGTRITIVVGPR